MNDRPQGPDWIGSPATVAAMSYLDHDRRRQPIARRLLALFAAAAVICLVAASLADASSRYHRCSSGQTVIKAIPNIRCGTAIRIADHGLRVDGDDGVHFRVYGERWQCVTIGRPDHGRHTLIGCYTPSAPRNLALGHRPLVTILLKIAGN